MLEIAHLKSFLSKMAIVVVWAILPVLASTASQSKPNVLFIAIDDLNDWVGCLGGYAGKVHTPNMDRLAERGVLFSNAHCTEPLCNPSRVSLLTGIRSAGSGVYGLEEYFRDSDALKNAVTIPQHFKASGYKTMAAGKIFHGWDASGPWSCWSDPQSWDMQSERPLFVEPPKKPNHPIPGFLQDMDYCALDVADEEMSDWKNMQWCIDRLRENHGKPIFLAAGIFRPHLPLYVPRKYFDLYPLEEIKLPEVKDDDWNDLPPMAKRFAAYGCFASPQDAKGKTAYGEIIKHGQYRKFVQAYLASISFADSCIGRLLDALDHSQYADNTMIIFWSDHGWHLGEKQHWEKFTLWEESTRSPLIIAAPGFPANRRCTQVVSLIDIYKTLIDLCGLKDKKGIEGHSLVPLLLDPQMEWPYPAVTTFFQNNHSVRYKNWRYTRYSDNTEELYDLDSDPNEWTNLAGKEEFTTRKGDLSKWFPVNNADRIPTWKPVE